MIFTSLVAVLASSMIIDAGPAFATTAPGPALLWGDLEPGAYPVGFRVIYARDHSRGWQDATHTKAAPELGRPIRISLWYPAVIARDTGRMLYGDYLHYKGPATFRALDEELEKSDRESWLSDLNGLTDNPKQFFAELLATPVAAYANAAPTRGRFPLVMYSPGLGARGDSNEELAEFLASHGFVVATIPQLGPSEKELALGSSPTDIALHVRDIDFARSVLARLADVDNNRVATIGHSAGGEAALLYAMKHPELRAVVGLDGSYGFKGGASIMKRTDGYTPGRIKAAILDLRRSAGVQSAELDLSVLDASTAADRYEAKFQRTYHGDFTEWAPIAFKLSAPLPPNADGRTRKTGYDSNQRAYQSVLEFLNAELRGVGPELDEMVDELQSSSGVSIIHKPPQRQGVPKV